MHADVLIWNVFVSLIPMLIAMFMIVVVLQLVQLLLEIEIPMKPIYLIFVLMLILQSYMTFSHGRAGPKFTIQDESGPVQRSGGEIKDSSPQQLTPEERVLQNRDLINENALD